MILPQRHRVHRELCLDYLCDSAVKIMFLFSFEKIYDYQSLNLKIVQVVVEKHIYDSLKFAKVILEA